MFAQRQQPDRANFDSVYTLAGWANGAGANVKEMRFAIEDGDMHDFDAATDLWPLVESAHADWKAGKRVLIRCRAGLNRSGLVMALVLIREGYEPQDAIDLIREKRGEDALCNWIFVEWLLTEARPTFWRAEQAA
jgi:protein-tyrosine phosphatase